VIARILALAGLIGACTTADPRSSDTGSGPEVAVPVTDAPVGKKDGSGDEPDAQVDVPHVADEVRLDTGPAPEVEASPRDASDEQAAETSSEVVTQPRFDTVPVDAGPELPAAVDVMDTTASQGYPVLVAHGFAGGSGGIFAYNGVAEALVAAGFQAGAAEVPPFDSIAVRAGFLAEDVDALLDAYQADKVHIIAHSMGGLDSRYLVTHMGYFDKVASITSIASPHRGTYIADAVIGLVPDEFDVAVNAFATLLGMSINEVADDAHLQDALTDISEANTPYFNADTPDRPEVYYQSWAAVSHVFGSPGFKDDEACEGLFYGPGDSADSLDPLLVANAPIVAHGWHLYPNDGLVRVSSSKWGSFRGCLRADHLDQVGQVNDSGPDPDTGFDHIAFYIQVATELEGMDL
jgi:triacylglycerol lipase